MSLALRVSIAFSFMVPPIVLSRLSGLERDRTADREGCGAREGKVSSHREQFALASSASIAIARRRKPTPWSGGHGCGGGIRRRSRARRRLSLIVAAALCTLGRPEPLKFLDRDLVAHHGQSRVDLLACPLKSETNRADTQSEATLRAPNTWEASRSSRTSAQRRAADQDLARQRQVHVPELAAPRGLGTQRRTLRRWGALRGRFPCE